MFIFAAVAFLIIVLVVIKPMMEERQDRELAERLKNVKSPTEASLMLDSAMRSRQEGSGFISGAMQVLRSFFHM